MTTAEMLSRLAAIAPAALQAACRDVRDGCGNLTLQAAVTVKESNAIHQLYGMQRVVAERSIAAADLQEAAQANRVGVENGCEGWSYDRPGVVARYFSGHYTIEEVESLLADMRNVQLASDRGLLVGATS